MSLPTVADLKVHSNMTSTEHDDELADVLDAAVEMVAGVIGPLVAASVTETHYGASSRTLLLRRMPVGELTAISARSYGYAHGPLLPADYVVDRDAGVIRLASGGYFTGDVTVTYSTGRATVPADIRLAILIVAAHLWETQRMPGQPIDSAPAGFGGADGIPDASSGRGFALPNRAQELLQRYMRPAIA